METVEAVRPFYVIGELGGFLFLASAVIMAYNLWMTVRYGEHAVEAVGHPTAVQPAE